MRRILEGIVVSIKMQKTAVVEVTRRKPHPLYKKLLKRNKRYLVDSGDFSVSLGDKVKIVETRPSSKQKYFKVLEVLKKVKDAKKLVIKEKIERPVEVKKK